MIATIIYNIMGSAFANACIFKKMLKMFFKCTMEKSPWNMTFGIICTTSSNYVIFLPYFIIVFCLYIQIFSEQKMGTFCGSVWVNYKKWCVRRMSPQGLVFNISSGT